jgi:hypothetical protein
MADLWADWRLEFMAAHPTLFRIAANEPQLSFGYPLCQVGWRDIIDRVCGRIEHALRESETFEFCRIRQRLGILRVDWDGEVSDDTRIRIVQAVDLAVARSACSCEICGAEGRLYACHGGLSTSCADHAVGSAVNVKAGLENIRLYRWLPGRSDMYRARYDRETDTLTELPPCAAGPEA